MSRFLALVSLACQVRIAMCGAHCDAPSGETCFDEDRDGVGLLQARTSSSRVLGHPPSSKGKIAFVLLGANGDNAIRKNGVIHGLYEAWCGGVYGESTMSIYPISSKTPEQLTEWYTETLTIVQDDLDKTDWTCKAVGGNCTPAAFLSEMQWNTVGAKKPDGSRKSASEQAQELEPDVKDYGTIIEYMSIPPYTYGDWANATAVYWDTPKGRLQLALEKPFGESIESANALEKLISDAGITLENQHMVDHWLSFFMIKNLPAFRQIVQPRLGIEWSSKDIKRIVVTQYEERGLEGRGGFFNTVGQVRDMIQSHLLQTLALFLIDPADSTADLISEAKLKVFDATNQTACTFGQYEGWLLEDDLTFHADFADSTLCYVNYTVSADGMDGVEIVIQTGKFMGEFLYTIDVFQEGGPGNMTYYIGRESLGKGEVVVNQWPLKEDSSFEAPAPGFQEGQTVAMTPDVSTDGNGIILNYSNPDWYFPTPYAMMMQALVTGNYGTAFGTWPQVQQQWVVVTGPSPSMCLDPAPDRVDVYQPPETCGNMPPNVCWLGVTVQDVYDDDFSCNSTNATITDSDLFKDKCSAE
jgi:glucose-6-phosphate 1-dehydrogenase